MKMEKLTQVLLAIVGIALVALVLRPFVAPSVAHADDKSSYTLSANGNIAWVVKDGRISAYRATNNDVEYVGATYVR
jgi:hypothetical protein